MEFKFSICLSLKCKYLPQILQVTSTNCVESGEKIFNCRRENPKTIKVKGINLIYPQLYIGEKLINKVSGQPGNSNDLKTFEFILNLYESSEYNLVIYNDCIKGSLDSGNYSCQEFSTVYKAYIKMNYPVNPRTFSSIIDNFLIVGKPNLITVKILFQFEFRL